MSFIIYFHALLLNVSLVKVLLTITINDCDGSTAGIKHDIELV